MTNALAVVPAASLVALPPELPNLAAKRSRQARGNVVHPIGKVLALRSDDPWRNATDTARAQAIQREIVVHYLRSLLDCGISQNRAVDLMLERYVQGKILGHTASAIKATAKKDRAAPTRSTLCQWLADYRDGGVAALLPEYKGRVVESAAWWGPALEYFGQPSKPDIAAVHRRLVELDNFACTYDQVRSYLNSVPAMHGRASPARIGKKLYRQTQAAWLKRCTANLLPGDIYMADGYRADVYLAHPATGDIWRPEIMHVIDLASRMLVGWRVMAHEGGYDVMVGWAESFGAHNHVPPLLYVDNGSGYKNKFTEDDLTSYYQRAGVIDVIHSIPQNPKGKGHIERFHRIVRDDFLKLWQPRFYCGPDASKDHLDVVVRDCKAGRLTPPSLAEFMGAFAEWVSTRYANRPHPEQPGYTRQEIWGQLQPIPPHATVAEMARPQIRRTVHRATVQFANRRYGHADLHAWNRKEVIVEYDLCDTALVTVRDTSGRLVCDAKLSQSLDLAASTHIDDKRQQALLNAEKRLEKKLEETRQRAGIVVDAQAIADDAVEFVMPVVIPEAEAVPIELDLTDLD